MINLNTSASSHCTQFMIDFMQANTQQPTTLQQFIHNEEQYDISFCKAWSAFSAFSGMKQPEDTNNFLAVLDRIQKCASSHFDNKVLGKPGGGNYYWISKNLLADEIGIADIIQKIWVKREEFQLKIYLDNPTTDFYLLTNTNFSFCKFSEVSEENEFYTEGPSIESIVDVDDHDEGATLNIIHEIILPLFNQGRRPKGDKRERITLRQYTPVEVRDRKAREIANNYFTDIASTQTDLEKIKVIVTAARDLMHLHRYRDGNGRSTYIMVNLLLKNNDLQLTYPRNMCVFDANSIPRMVTEVIEGQKRFVEKFGDVKTLTKGLNLYKEKIEELGDLVPMDEEDLSDLYVSRELTELFQESSKYPKFKVITDFLRINAQILNVDVSPIKEIKQDKKDDKKEDEIE